MGQNEESRRIAREIADRLSALPEADLDVWERAIVGEAYLLLGDLARAKSWYMKAVALDPAAQGPREIMRDQARRNLQYLGLPTAGLDDVLT